MASFWKKITRKKKIAGFLLSFFFLLFSIWLALPDLVGWGLRNQSEDFGCSDFEVEVEQVDPWLSRFSSLRMEKEESLSLNVDHADLLYSPGSLAEGKIDAISLTGLSLDLFGENPLPESTESEKVEIESLETMVANFMSQPSLTHLRVRDSALSLTRNGVRYSVDFLLQGDFYPEWVRMIFDGSFLGCLFESHFNLEQNESGAFATARVKIPDLAQLQTPLKPTTKPWNLSVWQRPSQTRKNGKCSNRTTGPKEPSTGEPPPPHGASCPVGSQEYHTISLTEPKRRGARRRKFCGISTIKLTQRPLTKK